jgi:opacity protein-like surface antigen
MTGGWYLRGYIGQSNQFANSISHPSFETAPQFEFLDKGGFDSAPFYGAGVGYQWTSWLRTDVTGEYRGKAAFHALDRYFNAGYFTNESTASKSEWVALVNAYIDLGTWWSITPFVGAGVGVAFNTIEHFRDNNVIAGGGGFADTGRQTNLAWALHAGASYRASSNLAVELSYRYLNVGNAHSGNLVNLDPLFVSGNPIAPVTFHNIQSHDLMLGLRWMLQPEPMYQPPFVRKG